MIWPLREKILDLPALRRQKVVSKEQIQLTKLQREIKVLWKQLPLQQVNFLLWI